MAAAVGAATTGAVGLAASLQFAVSAGELELHPPHFPWSHSGPLQSLDHQGYVNNFDNFSSVCYLMS